MADLTGFDANEYDEMADFEPIPDGKYLSVITKSELKQTKSKTGEYLELTFTIVDGKHKNRLLWARLNLNNQSDKAVEIARSQLSSICRAVGIMQPKNSEELHNIPLLINVKCKKRDDNGEMINEIRGFSKRGAITPQTNTQQISKNESAPWEA